MAVGQKTVNHCFVPFLVLGVLGHDTETFPKLRADLLVLGCSFLQNLVFYQLDLDFFFDRNRNSREVSAKVFVLSQDPLEELTNRDDLFLHPATPSNLLLVVQMRREPTPELRWWQQVTEIQKADSADHGALLPMDHCWGNQKSEGRRKMSQGW